MRPKKTLIEAAEKDGSMARLNQLLSASQILLCEANNLVEEASDLMKERGLMLGTIKQLHTRFVQSADAYFQGIFLIGDRRTIQDGHVQRYGQLRCLLQKVGKRYPRHGNLKIHKTIRHYDQTIIYRPVLRCRRNQHRSRKCPNYG